MRRPRLGLDKGREATAQLNSDSYYTKSRSHEVTKSRSHEVTKSRSHEVTKGLVHNTIQHVRPEVQHARVDPGAVVGVNEARRADLALEVGLRRHEEGLPASRLWARKGVGACCQTLGQTAGLGRDGHRAV